MSEETKASIEKADKKRRAYDAPRLAKVDLAADEVLSFGCKQLSSGSSPLSIGNCIIKGCAVAGS